MLHNFTADFFFRGGGGGVRHETVSSKRCPQHKKGRRAEKKVQTGQNIKGNFINSAKLSKRCIFQYFLFGKMTPVFQEDQLRLCQYRQ